MEWLVPPDTITYGTGILRTVHVSDSPLTFDSCFLFILFCVTLFPYYSDFLKFSLLIRIFITLHHRDFSSPLFTSLFSIAACRLYHSSPYSSPYSRYPSASFPLFNSFPFLSLLFCTISYVQYTKLTLFKFSFFIFIFHCIYLFICPLHQDTIIQRLSFLSLFFFVCIYFRCPLYHYSAPLLSISTFLCKF